MEKLELANWLCRFKLSKYHQDIEPYRGREGKFHQLFTPYEVIEGEGNLLLNEGIDEMWDLITGAGGTAYNNSNARIGVGNGTAAAVVTQTGLQGASTAFKGMETAYPTSIAQKATFKSSFGDTEGNFAWEEWTVDNGATANKNLNRKVESLGTKSGGTWTLEVSITLS